MYGYNAHYKNFYVGGNPFSDDGAGIPTGNNTVVVSPVEITENEWHTFKLKITAGGERTVSMWLDGELALKYTKCTDGAGTFYLDGRSLNMTWANITAKTGRIAGVAIVDDEDDVMLIENGGVLIRMAAADINVYTRDTQGVILMRVEAGNRVISVDRVDREPEETADEHEEA